MSTPIKDPEAVLDYMVDWGSEALPARKRWLKDGDQIATSSWRIDPDVGDDQLSMTTGGDHTEATTTVWLEGGTNGVDYDLINRITTTQGRSDERTFTILVRAR